VRKPRQSLQRRTPLRLTGFALSLEPRKRLSHRSPSKAGADRKYAVAKAAHFAEHPGCQHPDGCRRSLRHGDLMDLHHRAGRNGPLLYNREYFATACRAHHDLAKSDPIGSRANGWVVTVSIAEVRRLKEAEL
jgi:hypothetical protein